jgi:uncharacterized surface protein with fasciclin (FAS1) repeats
MRINDFRRSGLVRALALTGLLAFGLAACDDNDDGPTNLPADNTIADLAGDTPQLSTLNAALEAAGLDEALAGEGLFTVFAPVDDAFANLPTGTVEALLASGNEEILTDLLTYHVVDGAAVTSDMLTDGQVVTTAEGDVLTIGVSESGVTVNGANVITANIVADNGVIHLIDGVLTETLDAVQRATITPDLSTLVTAVVAGGLVETLQGDDPYTIFAPVNSAFASLSEAQLAVLLDPANQSLLQKVLTYHVIPGDIRAADLTDGATVTTGEGTEVTIDLSKGAKVNGANIIATDIVVSNGVIHLIDGVLTENLDIVDQAILNGFNTLVGAVGTAGLEDVLRSDNGGDGYTVFAPTDAAFAALESIPTDPTVLSQVLLYHALGSTVLSTDLSDGQIVPTAQGGSLTVSIIADAVLLEGAQNTVQVTATDVLASNGVIHVINAVLLPPTP